MIDSIEDIARFAATGKRLVVATIVRTKGSAPRQPGARMVVGAEGLVFGTVGGGQLEAQIIADALKVLAEGGTDFQTYHLCARAGQCCGGTVEVFLERINDQPRLMIFGTGHVGTALAGIMAATAFRVHAIDDRPEWCGPGRFPASVICHTQGWRQHLQELPWDPRDTYAVVMTHSHDEDLEIIRELVRRPLRFIGLIGSRTKWQQFQRRLGGMGISAEELARVQCPVGVKLGGAKAPMEIAISIAAQVLGEHFSVDKKDCHGAGRPASLLEFQPEAGRTEAGHVPIT